MELCIACRILLTSYLLIQIRKADPKHRKRRKFEKEREVESEKQSREKTVYIILYVISDRYNMLTRVPETISVTAGSKRTRANRRNFVRSFRSVGAGTGDERGAIVMLRWMNMNVKVLKQI